MSCHESGRESDPWALKRLLLRELERHPFRAPRWLRAPHLQTAWSPLVRRAAGSPFTRRERLETPDDDWLLLHHHDGEPGRPLVLLLHGLEGSVRSNYMVGLGRAFARLGWSVTGVEWRSCSGEMNRARRLYHSGETTDLEFVVETLHRRLPGSRLYIGGISLGGNVAAKWLGERGETVPENVTAACAVSPPFDLTVSGPQIDRALGGLYVRRFLRTLIPKALAKERQYPGCLDVEAVRRSRTFLEFDTHATAALHGFHDAEHYWDASGCGQFLERIRRPTLLIAAADDPFNPCSALPHGTIARSPHLVGRFPARGGHVGFVHGLPGRTRHWAEEQMVLFFQTAEDMRADSGGHWRRTVEGHAR